MYIVHEVSIREAPSQVSLILNNLSSIYYACSLVKERNHILLYFTYQNGMFHSLLGLHDLAFVDFPELKSIDLGRSFAGLRPNPGHGWHIRRHRDLHVPRTMLRRDTFRAANSCRLLTSRGQDYSFASDIWSVGMVLFELSTGRYPFAERLWDLFWGTCSELLFYM